MNKRVSLLAGSLILLASLTASCVGKPAADLTMWFDKPAEAYRKKSPLQSWTVESQKRTDKSNPDQAWEKYALPLGNGFIGAMIYGGTS